MTKNSRVCDVYIAHAAADAKLAAEIADACRANGLEAITDSELPPGDEASDALWHALAESRALLTILPPTGPTPLMGIELGAAGAWSKPIFCLLTDPTATRLPASIAGAQVYPPGRVGDIIAAIKKAGQELSDADRTLLARLYAEAGVSVDQLALDPGQLEELATRFKAVTGKSPPAERLLSELLRMRKQGALARHRSANRSKPRKGTA